MTTETGAECVRKQAAAVVVIYADWASYGRCSVAFACSRAWEYFAFSHAELATPANWLIWRDAFTAACQEQTP